MSSVPLAHGDMLLCTNDELHGEYGEARVTPVLEEAARAEASPESTIRSLFARLDEFGIIPDAQPAALAVRFSG